MKPKKEKRLQKHAVNILINLFLLAMVISSLVPFVYMVFTSLRQVYSMVDFSFALSELNLNNYVTVFRNFPFLRYFSNSVIVVVFSCLLCINRYFITNFFPTFLSK